MNERIKTLALQAEAYAQAEYSKWTPTPDFSGVPHVRNIFSQKFAELIVRECANKVKDFYQEDEFTCYNAAEEIKEHFGIEE